MSFDDPDENADWREEEGFEYELWSDADRVLALAYGAASSSSQTIASRITVILDADGVLVLEYLSDINLGTHPIEVLEDCEILFGD